MTNLDSILKAMTNLDSRDITLPTKVCLVQGYGFSSSHVRGMRVGSLRRLSPEELILLNYGAGEDLESSLDNKEIKPVNPEGNQP